MKSLCDDLRVLLDAIQMRISLYQSEVVVGTQEYSLVDKVMAIYEDFEDELLDAAYEVDDETEEEK